MFLNKHFNWHYFKQILGNIISNTLIIFILTLFFTSCNNVENKDNITINNNSVITDTFDIIPDTIKKNKEFSCPIDLKKLLREDFLETTSGIYRASETEEFFKPSISGFFGSYTLLNKNGPRGKKYIGDLIIYTTERAENWRQDSDNQFFIGIKLEQSTISIWDSVKVGISEKTLLDFIGENFHYKKGTTIYSELGDFSCSFIIKGDSVSFISVIKYKKD